MTTSYLYLVRELKHDVFTHLHFVVFPYLVDSVTLGQDMLLVLCTNIHSQSPTVQSLTIQL